MKNEFCCSAERGAKFQIKSRCKEALQWDVQQTEKAVFCEISKAKVTSVAKKAFNRSKSELLLSRVRENNSFTAWEAIIFNFKQPAIVVDEKTCFCTEINFSISCSASQVNNKVKLFINGNIFVSLFS